MRIIGLKNCDKCRAARKSLPDFEFQDLRDIPLTDLEIQNLFDEYGSDFLNKRSTTWRGLSEEQRGQSPVALAKAHPTLIKRPVFICEDGAIYLGWDDKVRQKIIA